MQMHLFIFLGQGVVDGAETMVEKSSRKTNKDKKGDIFNLDLKENTDFDALFKVSRLVGVCVHMSTEMFTDGNMKHS